MGRSTPAIPTQAGPRSWGTRGRTPRPSLARAAIRGCSGPAAEGPSGNPPCRLGRPPPHCQFPGQPQFARTDARAAAGPIAPPPLQKTGHCGSSCSLQDKPHAHRVAIQARLEVQDGLTDHLFQLNCVQTGSRPTCQIGNAKVQHRARDQREFVQVLQRLQVGRIEKPGQVSPHALPQPGGRQNPRLA
jgi:hypothetical protein